MTTNERYRFVSASKGDGFSQNTLRAVRENGNALQIE